MAEKAFILFGTGDFSDLIYDLIVNKLSRTVAFYCLDQEYMTASEHRGIPILPFEKLAAACSPHSHTVALGFIGRKMFLEREEKFRRLKELGYTLENLLWPGTEAFATIGEGNIVFQNVSVGGFAKLGDGNIIWPGAVFPPSQCHRELQQYFPLCFPLGLFLYREQLHDRQQRHFQEQSGGSRPHAGRSGSIHHTGHPAGRGAGAAPFLCTPRQEQRGFLWIRGKVMKLSVVIPCYNSENSLEGVACSVVREMGKLGYDYEVILVNDCSPDGTFRVISKLCAQDPKIKGISLSKNFGQQAAILAALNHVTGDFVLCMDDDGQSPIEHLGEMVSKLSEGYDVVFAKYTGVKQSFFRRVTSRFNAFMASLLTAKPKNISTASFFLMRAFVAKNIMQYKGPYPYLSGLIFRVTINAANLPMPHAARKYGRSGYSFRKLFSLWFNGFTSFSVKPLRIASFIGLLTSLIGFGYGIYVVIRKLLNESVAVGYSSLVALVTFIGGIILLCLGLIGEYIGRSYICINNSPQYIIRETVNMKEK